MEEKEAQVIIALSFGQGRNGTPGLSNEALARAVAVLDDKYNLPIVAQWEIADCIPERMKEEKDLIVDERRQDKQYFDTLEVLGQAKDHCARFGLVRAIIVAHPDHLPQAMPAALRKGLKSVAADTKNVPYDPDSVQEWTRSHAGFLIRNYFVEHIFPSWSVPLKETAGNNIKLTILGAAVAGDLNADGANDYASAFYQESKNGEFYYLMAGIVDQRNFSIAGTTEVFLGKNIDFGSLSIEDGVIIVKIDSETKKFIVEGNKLKEMHGG